MLDQITWTKFTTISLAAKEPQSMGRLVLTMWRLDNIVTFEHYEVLVDTIMAIPCTSIQPNSFYDNNMRK